MKGVVVRQRGVFVPRTRTVVVVSAPVHLHKAQVSYGVAVGAGIALVCLTHANCLVRDLRAIWVVCYTDVVHGPDPPHCTSAVVQVETVVHDSRVRVGKNHLSPVLSKRSISCWQYVHGVVEVLAWPQLYICYIIGVVKDVLRHVCTIFACDPIGPAWWQIAVIRPYDKHNVVHVPVVLDSDVENRHLALVDKFPF